MTKKEALNHFKENYTDKEVGINFPEKKHYSKMLFPFGQ